MAGKIFLTILVLIIAPEPTLATPNISGVSGNITHDSQITINGSGFGIKDPVKPILWAPFEGSINPSSKGRITLWNGGQGGCELYDASGGIGGGGAAKTKSSCNESIPQAFQLYVNTNSIGVQLNPLNGKLYAFRQRKLINHNGNNLKSIEFNGSSYGQSDLIYNHSSSQWITQGISPSSYFYIDGSPENQWISEELIAQVGATNGAQAQKLDWYYNNHLAGRMGYGGAAICLNGGDADDRMVYAALAYHGDYNGPTTMSLEYFDNLYLDNTWSRIIIGDRDTLTNSAHREIQIPSAWSINSITITANQGSFVNGQQVYLYVIDTNGEVNANGYPVTIGGGEDMTAPNIPSGLSVR